MDKDRIKGVGQQIKGTIKKTVGEMAGDVKLQTEGEMDKAEGKVRNAIGGLKDSLREGQKQ